MTINNKSFQWDTDTNDHKNHEVSFDIFGIPDTIAPTITDKFFIKNKEVISYYKELLALSICNTLKLSVTRDELPFQYKYVLFNEEISELKDMVSALWNSKYLTKDDFISGMLAETNIIRFFDCDGSINLDNVNELDGLNLYILHDLFLTELYNYYESDNDEISIDIIMKTILLTSLVKLHINGYDKHSLYKRSGVYSKISSDEVENIFKEIQNINVNPENITGDPTDYTMNFIYSVDPAFFIYDKIIQEISNKISSILNINIDDERLLLNIYFMGSKPLTMLNPYPICSRMYPNIAGSNIETVKALADYCRQLKDIMKSAEQS